MHFKKTKKIIILALLFLIASCSHIKVRKAYYNMWDSRLQEYQSRFDYERKQTNEKITKLLSRDSFPKALSEEELWREFFSRISKLNKMSYEASIIQGRAQALKAFLTYINEERRTGGQVLLWFLHKHEELQEAVKETGEKFNAFAKSLDDEAFKDLEWLDELKIFFSVNGSYEGMAKEYKLLLEEFKVYYTDLAHAYARDYTARMQIAEGIKKAGESFQRAADRIGQRSFQDSLLNALNRPRTCYFLGDRMSCY